MRCVNCERELEKREHAQVMVINDRKYWPKSLCDPCAHANLWRPGSDVALQRLGTGRVDAMEAAKVLAATAGWGRARATEGAWLASGGTTTNAERSSP